jgi:dTDP-D-glucose 4,6-dehydratase
VKWGPLLEGDIAEAVRLRAAHEQYRPAALMHLSAYAYVGELVQKPLLYYRNNFAATATLLHTLTCDWRDGKGSAVGRLAQVSARGHARAGEELGHLIINGMRQAR